MKGKEIVGVGMLFCRGWREIRGEMRKKMKKKWLLRSNSMRIKGMCHHIVLGASRAFKRRPRRRCLVAGQSHT
jgi:hypothetical protein